MMFVRTDAAPVATASGRGDEPEERAAPVNSVVKHVLSQELLLYLDRVKGLLRGQRTPKHHLPQVYLAPCTLLRTGQKTSILLWK